MFFMDLVVKMHCRHWKVNRKLLQHNKDETNVAG